MLLGLRFGASTDDVRDVAVVFNRAKVLCSSVAGVSAQMLVSPLRRVPALDDDGGENIVESLAVMNVGPAHDERQRDATTVHQQMTLAAFFSPDPSGWGQQLPGPAAPSSSRHPRFASARRCPPSGRTRPGPLSIDPQRTPQLPTQGIACGRCLRCQSAPWAGPSIGSPCAAQRRWPRTPSAPALAAGPLQACAHRSCPLVSARESMAPHVARTHRLPPMTQYVWPSSRSNVTSHCDSDS